jgi:hypothetical protein
MKKIFKLISFVLIFAIVITNTSITVNAETETTTDDIEILFIGNSKTISYGSPALTFSDIANLSFSRKEKSKQKDIKVTICAEYGKSLLYMYEHYRKIIEQDYDYVIVQEAIHPYLGRTSNDKANYEKGVKKIYDIVVEKNSNVKFFVRQVWVGEEVGDKDIIKGAGQALGLFYIRDPEKSETNVKTYISNLSQKYKTSVKNSTKFTKPTVSNIEKYKDTICTSSEKDNAYKLTETIVNKINNSRKAGTQKIKIIYDGYIMGAYNNEYINTSGIPKIFQTDKFHQSKYGSLISAISIYAGIFNELPVLKNGDVIKHGNTYNFHTSSKQKDIINAVKSVKELKVKELKKENKTYTVSSSSNNNITFNELYKKTIYKVVKNKYGIK